MSDVTVDQTGISREGDGTIAPSPTSEASPPSTTSTQPTEKPSLLNQTEAAPAEAPKPPEGSKAPEKYEDYKVPDGYTLDPEIKTEADTLFKGLGLSQAQAQSLVDFYTAKTTEAFNAPYEAFAEMSDRWSRESMEHPDLRGKLGPGKEVTVRIAKLLDGLGDPTLSRDFRQVMDLTAAGNHPAFIRVLNHLAQKLTEGTPVMGRGPSEFGQSKPGDARQPTAAQALFPNLPSSGNR